MGGRCEFDVVLADSEPAFLIQGKEKGLFIPCNFIESSAIRIHSLQSSKILLALGQNSLPINPPISIIKLEHHPSFPSTMRKKLSMDNIEQTKLACSL